MSGIQINPRNQKYARNVNLPIGTEKEKMRKQIEISKDILGYKYLVEKKSFSEIAREIHVSETTIWRLARKYKIPIIKQWQRYFEGDIEECDIRLFMANLR